MSVYGGINPYESSRFGFGYIDTIQQQRAVTTTSQPRFDRAQRSESSDNLREVMRIREAVQAIRPMMLASQEVQVASPASATSASDLGLNTTPTAATLQSTEEVNTTPTSYSTHSPQWTGSSTAQATISGTYDGSNGTDTLTFEVDRHGIHGSQNLRIKVYDSSMTEIDTIDISKNDPIDQQYTMSNGLVLTLGAGDLARNDSFTLDVSDSVGTAVDPDNPFNGSGVDDPNLQAGLSVSDGSFEINGTTINVQQTDSLNMVLDTINQSDAGVTATFDAATETVVLTHNTAGSGQDIVLANDTSGFLAAFKLDGATATPGTDGEADKALDQVAAFSTVQSGSISVNGVSIDIDVTTDSLNDVLDRISASSAGVDASFSSASQQVSLTAQSTGEQMELSSGATNFFAAVDISEGTYEAADDQVETAFAGVEIVDVTDNIVDSLVEENTVEPWEIQESATTAVSATDGEMMTALVGVISNAMNRLFDDSAASGSPDAFLEGVRNDIRSTVSSWSGSQGTQFDSGFGINFDFEKTREGVFKFSAADQHQFKAALATPQGASAVSNALFGQDASGLFSQLHASLNAAVTGLGNEIDTTGLYLDITA